MTVHQWMKDQVDRAYDKACEDLKKARRALDDAKVQYEKAHYAKYCPHDNIKYKGGFTHIEEQCEDCGHTWYS